MKNLIKIIFMALMTLMLVGCGGSSGDNLGDNWKVGTTGVVMNIMPNAPPAEAYAGETYPLSIQLKNLGTYPLDEDDLDVELYFVGFDPEVLDLPDSDSIAIPDGGITAANRQGGEELYDIEFDVMSFEDSDVLEQPLNVIACYDYETNAGIAVCVDPDPVNNDNDVCTPGSPGVGAGQGAPISVSNIQQDTLKGKVRFTITLSNVGGGSVMVDDECIAPERSSKDKVELISVYLGNDELDCSPEDLIRFNGGSARLSCTYDDLDVDRPAYKTSLGIRVGYTYKTSVSTSVNVKRLE